jgi:hypothetical protein
MFEIPATSRISDTLRALPPEARARTLRLLTDEQLPDTRRIVESLSQQFGNPTELTRAGTPGARSDEASPAET